MDCNASKVYLPSYQMADQRDLCLDEGLPRRGNEDMAA